MAEENIGEEIQEQEPVNQEAETPEVDEGNLTDKHGQDAISKGKYTRDMAAKDKEIAELRKQIEAATESKETRKELEGKIDKLEGDLATQKMDFALERAECIDKKAAKARLDEFDGDVEKLKEACPYLFKKAEKGATGLPPKGKSNNDLLSKIDRAMGGRAES